MSFRWVLQDCSNSCALAMELLQFFTKPLIWSWWPKNFTIPCMFNANILMTAWHKNAFLISDPLRGKSSWSGIPLKSLWYWYFCDIFKITISAVKHSTNDKALVFITMIMYLLLYQISKSKVSTICHHTYHHRHHHRYFYLTQLKWLFFKENLERIFHKKISVTPRIKSHSGPVKTYDVVKYWFW